MIAFYFAARSKSELDLEAFQALHNEVKRGDIVGVRGYPGKSKKGELSLFPTHFVILAPCLHMPPSLHFGLKDQVRAPAGGLNAVRCQSCEAASRSDPVQCAHMQPRLHTVLGRVQRLLQRF